MFVVRLLGTFSAEYDTQPLYFRTDKVKALFSYLLLHPNEHIPREHLATLLWPENDDRRARKNLRDGLFHLRKALDQHIAKISQQVLFTTRSSVQLLVADNFDVDTIRLTENEPAEESAFLINGDLLTGFFVAEAEPFNEWLLLERERWHNRSLALLAQWTDHYLTHKQPQRAQQLAQKQLQFERWHEAAHRQALSAYGLAQDWAGVAHQYTLCRDVLWDELGVEPSAATQALYQTLQQKQKALANPLHNLPTTLTPFIGRKPELAHIGAAIDRRDYRLFTLSAIGGSGKTRLAIEIGRQQIGNFPDGVWFVPLASANHSADLLPAIASALNLRLDTDSAIEEQLYAYLAQKKALLILDNLEQLPEEIADIIFALLQQCQQIVILTTSRSTLNLRVENIFTIDGLPFPDEQAHAQSTTAVTLFLEHAARVRYHPLPAATHTAVGAICRLLTGSPLAIELAAAQTQTKTVDEIAESLHRNIAELSTSMRDIPQRHRSLRAVFVYSWRLLTPAQKQGLAQLALFRQPFSAEAAQAVAHIARADLTVLTRSSWLRIVDGERYQLHELLRAFAHEHLSQNASWLEVTKTNFVTYQLRFLREQGAELYSNHGGQALSSLLQSRADLVQAWRFGIEQSAYTELIASAEAFGRFYRTSGFLLEGSQTLTALSDQVRQRIAQQPTHFAQRLLANLLLQYARVFSEMTVGRERYDTLQEAFELAQQTDDQVVMLEAQLGQVDILQRLGEFDKSYVTVMQIKATVWNHISAFDKARVLMLVGNICSEKQWFVVSMQHYQEALSLVDHTEKMLFVADLHHNLAIILTELGQYDQARALHELTLALWQQSGWHVSVSDAQVALADVLRQQGHFALARSYLQASLEPYQAVNHIRGVASVHLGLGHIAVAEGDLDGAEHHYQHLLTARRTIGNGELLFQAWAGLAQVAYERGQFAEANRWVEKVLPILLNDSVSGEDPFRAFWICYRILSSCADPRAQVILRGAVMKLQSELEQLIDPHARDAFLNVVLYRDLFDAYAAHKVSATLQPAFQS